MKTKKIQEQCNCNAGWASNGQKLHTFSPIPCSYFNQVEEQGLGEEFYELMQAYRSWPLSDQEGVIRAYENVINFIHSDKLKLLDLVEKEVVGEDVDRYFDHDHSGPLMAFDDPHRCGYNHRGKEQRQKLAAIREGLVR